MYLNQGLIEGKRTFIHKIIVSHHKTINNSQPLETIIIPNFQLEIFPINNFLLY